MAVKSLDEEALFHAARRIASADDRSQFLRHACGDDAGLAERVRALLAMHEQNPSEPEEPGEQTHQYEALDERAGSRVGPYTLREQIGEGGFGLVFVAEQQEPVRRKVALKVIKPGMDTRTVVARFEAERQALALMDHPNIAKVLDAGTTDSGRPYFVMELVRGMPITEYADAHHLTPRERLGLFVQVCQAVQHAHQKGIIHRDIKPSNVLVTVIDGVAIPKVIDFGVAKAVGQQLTDKTVYTRFAALVGTPLYMSPEQAELSGVDVDTRADIYALGVLLYELLTGTTPFDRERFRKAAFDEIRRIIKEEEPPRPSTRLTSLGETLTAVSAKRGTEPAKLAGVVRGELDWIVMRCLEKDRGRRYETATGLAKDVQRHLAGDAVEACPPTLGYRLRKVYRRNRAAVMVGGMIAGVLLLATGVSLVFGVQARQAERRAVQQEMIAEEKAREAAKSAADARAAAGDREAAINHLGGVLAKFNPYRQKDGTGNPSIIDVLDVACKSLEEGEGRRLSPIVRVKVRSVFGRMYKDIHEYDKSQAQWKKAFEELRELNGPDDLETLAAREAYAYALVIALDDDTKLQEAERESRAVYEARKRLLGAAHPATIKVVSEPLGLALYHQGKLADCEAVFERALEAALADPLAGERRPQIAHMQLRLALCKTLSGDRDRLEEARRLCLQAKETYTELHGPNATETIQAEVGFAIVLDEETDLAERVRQLKDITDRRIEAIRSEGGPNMDRDICQAYMTFNVYCVVTGHFKAAKESSKKVIELFPKVYGENHPPFYQELALRGMVCLETGDREEAERLARKLTTDMKLVGGSGKELDHLTQGELFLARLILIKEDLNENDFEEAKRNVAEFGKHCERQESKFNLGSLSRFSKLRWSMYLKTAIDLYEKWNKPEHEVELQMLRRKLNMLTS